MSNCCIRRCSESASIEPLLRVQQCLYPRPNWDQLTPSPTRVCALPVPPPPPQSEPRGSIVVVHTSPLKKKIHPL